MASPVIELTGEARLARRVGAALILGAGQATARNSMGEQQRIDLFEVGGQLNFYLFHELRGVHLGIEPTYIHANNARPDSSIASWRHLSANSMLDGSDRQARPR